MSVIYPGQIRDAGFFKGGGGGREETGEIRDLEKDPGTKERTNNKLHPHVAPGQNRTVAFVGNGRRRRAISRLRHLCSRRMCLLIVFPSCLCVPKNIFV